MSFLIDQIKEQKILEMEVNLDDFIKENNISESAMIHTMVFDKDVFAEEKEVREYLKDKYFFNPAITENENSFSASLISLSQMDADTEVLVELRRGVTASAADMLPVMTFDEVRFNDKGEVNLSGKFNDGEIHLNSGAPHIIEIARVSEGEHPVHGLVKITQEDLESFEQNHKSKVTGVDLSVNEDHKMNEAFGWFKDVFLSYDKQTLYASIAWNSKGTAALSEKEYRYFSPELRFNYKHPHTGEEHGATLVGGALTNYPFLKMDAIVELNQKSQTGEIKVSEKTIDLNEHNEALLDLNTKLTNQGAELETSKAKNIELSAKIVELEDAKKKADQEKVHEKLFTENKISKAQLVALNEGKTMLEVLALNVELNTKEKGSAATEDDKEEIKLSDKESKMADQLGLTHEEFVNYNK